jgi:hypothetical protein
MSLECKKLGLYGVGSLVINFNVVIPEKINAE